MTVLNSGVDIHKLTGMNWRMIGPHRGGRVSAVAGDYNNSRVFYFGACGGGVWKTTDGGMYWNNVSDGFFRTAPVGAVAVSFSDSNVIYAGTGEAAIRGNVAAGDGVYLSTDAGDKWTHIGLENTRHIAKIRVHPSDPGLVYVAAFGDAFGPNKERGIYRSCNYGSTWEQVLFKSERAGAIDLVIDPNNPRILYASMWEAERKPWTFNSGGPDSGLWRSYDGGDSWQDLSNQPGMPKGNLGRIGIAVGCDSNFLWALVEADKGGLYRSENKGETWTLISGDSNLQARPWYFHHVFGDSQNPETVYVLSLAAWKSIDGGANFEQWPTYHGDNHDMWIDPNDNQRIIEGNDGGAHVSYNGGKTWSTIFNQPTAQFYHLDTDNNYPFRVYGTQQDNTAISVPTNVPSKGVILYSDCYPVGPSESGHIAVNPNDSNIIYSGAIGSSPGGGGNLLRYDHKSGQVRIVTVWPEVINAWGAVAAKYRFNWTFPILFSPHDPNVLYCTGNRAFRSNDEGTTWESISPDLSRNDSTKLQPSGGDITLDDTGAEHYCTIFAFVESPHEQGVMWAGTDDGLVHISKNNGTDWFNVTPNDLPEWSTVCCIEISPHDPGTAYIAATRYKLQDNHPYLFMTRDYGENWTRIDSGIPCEELTRVIREDPLRQGLLFVGSERGIYASFDEGGSWQKINMNLPIVPVHDIVIKEDDLVVATHGRSFWVLDDLTPFRESNGTKQTQLMTPRAAYRFLHGSVSERWGGPGINYAVRSGVYAAHVEIEGVNRAKSRRFIDAGSNPPTGAVVFYYLPESIGQDSTLTLTFMDEKSEVIKTFNCDSKSDTSDLSRHAGLNRFVWDLRYPDAESVEGDAGTTQSVRGPVSPIGVYQVRIEVGDYVDTKKFEVRTYPNVGANEKDIREQFIFLLKIRDKLSEIHRAINDIRHLKTELARWTETNIDNPAISEQIEGLIKKINSVEEKLIQTRFKSPLDRVKYPARFNYQLGELGTVVGSADYKPTKQSYEVYDELCQKIDKELERLYTFRSAELQDINELIGLRGNPQIK
jgi:photosystem II stability/assembly factor-like uncharacterized protein